MVCEKCDSTNFERDLKHFGYCHTCEFWLEKLEYANKPNVVRVDGVQYVIAPEDEDNLFRGFGGAKFHIRFNDGREVVTTNLWCNGNIPEKFRDRLPNNAEFIS